MNILKLIIILQIISKPYIDVANRNIKKIFPNIASGRKNFEYFEKRIKKNLEITNKYKKKIQKVDKK